MSNFLEKSWKKIAPFWPLKNLIACNPLSGFESMSIENALVEAKALFQQEDMPEEMLEANRQTIKWCSIYFDEGQAITEMPYKEEGFYSAWKKLAVWDKHCNRAFVNSLPENSREAISQCLEILKIDKKNHELFVTILLATLPGWASHIRYLAEWEEEKKLDLLDDFVAVRLAILAALWPEANKLIELYNRTKKKSAVEVNTTIKKIEQAENKYHLEVISALNENMAKYNSPKPAIAQFVFCIDVRSEPFRKALESCGAYETFGVAGFFGVPVRIESDLDNHGYNSCPVLIKPKYTVIQRDVCDDHEHSEEPDISQRIYQSLHYNFLTAFALADTIGSFSGLWSFIRTIFPTFASRISKPRYHKIEIDISNIPIEKRCGYALSVLKSIGLTTRFAPFVIICGHESSVQNSTYASLFECGACGGHSGHNNARILTVILNDSIVRERLNQSGIKISKDTIFISGVHNTTTDGLHLDITGENPELELIKNDLEKAGRINSSWRAEMLYHKAFKNGYTYTNKRSIDWAEIRPEYGLACNASFIIAPRWLTKNVNLQGRAFLHSYDWQQDEDGMILLSILSGPVIVGQWINAQYFFSALDNAAYGSGSKATHNVAGKIGVMQGNASDLMHGLPMQSVFYSDTEVLHEPLRLCVMIYATRKQVEVAIHADGQMQKLLKNGWLLLTCIEPHEQAIYMLNRDLKWGSV